MALTPPYWLQPNPNRGTAPRASDLPPKLDFEFFSSDNFDRIFTIYQENEDGTMSDEVEDIDGYTAEMGVWSGGDDGALNQIDTLTVGNGRLIIGSGTVRVMTSPGEMAAYPSEVFYALALTDEIPNTKTRIAGKLFLLDRLRTKERQ